MFKTTGGGRFLTGSAKTTENRLHLTVQGRNGASAEVVGIKADGRRAASRLQTPRGRRSERVLLPTAAFRGGSVAASAGQMTDSVISIVMGALSGADGGLRITSMVAKGRAFATEGAISRRVAVAVCVETIRGGRLTMRLAAIY